MKKVAHSRKKAWGVSIYLKPLCTYQLTPDHSRESIQGGIADDELSDSSEEVLIQYNSKPDYNVDEQYFKFMTMATQMAFGKS